MRRNQNANDADGDGRRCNVCPPDVNQCLFLASAALNRLIAEPTKCKLTLGLRKQSTLKGSLNLILLGKAQRAVACQRLERMDRELNGQHFVAGDRFTIADITALVAIDMGARLAGSHLTDWYETVSSRPSAKA
jgi:Glutathione S-transferase, C-terminal domain